jgi:hypothetical protein
MSCSGQLVDPPADPADPVRRGLRRCGSGWPDVLAGRWWRPSDDVLVRNERCWLHETASVSAGHVVGRAKLSPDTFSTPARAEAFGEVLRSELRGQKEQARKGPREVPAWGSAALCSIIDLVSLGD